MNTLRCRGNGECPRPLRGSVIEWEWRPALQSSGLILASVKPSDEAVENAISLALPKEIGSTSVVSLPAMEQRGAWRRGEHGIEYWEKQGWVCEWWGNLMMVGGAPLVEKWGQGPMMLIWEDKEYRWKVMQTSERAWDGDGDYNGQENRLCSGQTVIWIHGRMSTRYVGLVH